MSSTPYQVLAIARGELGVCEAPMGSNDGTGVRRFQAVTGAYRAPWCASFVQFVLTRAGIGPIANRSAGAYYIGDYARSHGWTIPQPRIGAVVVYRIGQGHIGLVERVYQDGSFDAIEGNEGNAVRRVRRHRSIVYCYFVPPGEVEPRKKQWLPRFEVVSSSGGNAVVRAAWGKWSKVGPRVPGLAKKYRDLRVRRKMVLA